MYIKREQNYIDRIAFLLHNRPVKIISTMPLFLLANYFTNVRGQQELAIAQTNITLAHPENVALANEQAVNYDSSFTAELYAQWEIFGAISERSLDLKRDLEYRPWKSLQDEIRLLKKAKFLRKENHISFFSSVAENDQEIFFKLINDYIIREAEAEKFAFAQEEMGQVIQTQEQNAKYYQLIFNDITTTENGTEEDANFLEVKNKLADDIKRYNNEISMLKLAKFEGVLYDAEKFEFLYPQKKEALVTGPDKFIFSYKTEDNNLLLIVIAKSAPLFEILD